MPANIDQNRAVYARKPAWHGLGSVLDDTFTAEEALRVLNPNNEPVRKVKVGVKVDGEWIEADDWSAVVERDPDNTDTFRTLGINSRDYGLVTIEEQFAFLDEVVGNIDGAHYEAAVRLRQGRQTVLTIDTGAAFLDPQGANDRIQKFIWGFNSFDSSWAFRVKMGNFRVECANMAAAALRGSTDKIVSGDWSTKHSTNIAGRVAAAQQTLGLWKDYNDLFFAEADAMIHTKLTDNAFDRLVKDLFTHPETFEKDEMAIEQTRVIYELGPACENIRGTVWGGYNAVTEYTDWYLKSRGSAKTSAQEMRLRKQLGENNPLKQQAWDRFYDLVTA